MKRTDGRGKPGSAQAQVDANLLPRRKDHDESGAAKRRYWLASGTSTNGSKHPPPTLEHHRVGAVSSRTDLAGQATQHRGPDGGSPFLANIIDTIGDAIFVKDQELKFLLVNRALCEFSGLGQEQFIGRTNADFLPPELVARFSEVDRRVFSSGNEAVHEETLCDARGWVRKIRITRRMFVGDDGRKVLVGVFTDLTELRQVECSLELVNQRLEALAHRDVLTGLLNRAAFEEMLVRTIARARQTLDTFSLLFMDLDGFKRVNDSYGHALGDELIKAVASRITATTRCDDGVARIGADEFVVLAPEGREADVAGMAERIAEAVSRPVELPGAEARTSISIGIARYPADGLDANALLRNADAAMHRAKSVRHAPYMFHEPQHSETAARQHQLENQLMQDVPNGRIYTEVQPIVSLCDAEVVGYEVLARWDPPRRGRVSPGEFIPMAEKLHLINALGESVLRQACQFIVHAGQPGQYVSVNVSSLQLRDQRFSRRVWRLLEETGARPSQLVLELTESALAEPGASETLEELRGSGMSVFIDDFGVGYSNLTRLHQFSFDAIKVDRGFVGGIEGGGIAVSMIKTIASLADELGVQLIAEGIESPRQTELLLKMGITRGQGYLYGRPIQAFGAEGSPTRAWPPA